MAKGLFLGFPGHGHVNPTIGLVKELVSDGDEITYYCTEEFRSKIEITGAKFIAYDAVSVEESIKGNYINSFRHLTSICNGLLDALWKTKDEHYDYIIYDSMINIGDKIAKILNIPHSVRSITTFAFSRRLLYDLTQSNIRMLLNFNVKEIHSRIKNMKKNYNVNFLRDFAKSLIKNNADLNIIFTSRYFQPRIQDFSGKYKFVGPSIANRNESLNLKIDNIENKKIIFISLGTVANQNLDFYKESFKAFEGKDEFLVIMSIGKKTKIDDLGKIPKNFLVYNYVPQLELLKKVDLFITHGGMNSTSEGLYNKIPLIVVPQFGDQFIVGKRVEEIGAGINLKQKNISAKEIAKAVNKIYTNENFYRDNVKMVGESLEKSGGYSKAKEEIDGLLGRDFRKFYNLYPNQR